MADVVCWIPTAIKNPDGSTIYVAHFDKTECAATPGAIPQKPPTTTPPSSGDTAGSLGAPSPPAQPPAPAKAEPSLQNLLKDLYYRPTDPQPDYSLLDVARATLNAKGIPA